MANVPGIYEKKSSRALQGGESTAFTFEARIRNQPDHGLAEALFLEFSPYGVMLPGERPVARKSWTLTPLGAANDGAWDCVAEYGSPTPSTNEYLLNFNISGEQQHITQALETVERYVPEGREKIDYQGAIGVVGSEVKGTDILVGRLGFGWTKYVPKEQVTTLYVKQLAAIAGRWNGSAFMDFEPGEIQFVGAQGSRRQRQDDWEINFLFDTSPNVSGITIGEITGIDKLGADYLWVTYEEFADETAGKVVPRPIQVNIERVSRFADFAPLGINV